MNRQVSTRSGGRDNDRDWPSIRARFEAGEKIAALAADAGIPYHSIYSRSKTEEWVVKSGARNSAPAPAKRRAKREAAVHRVSPAKGMRGDEYLDGRDDRAPLRRCGGCGGMSAVDAGACQHCFEKFAA